MNIYNYSTFEVSNLEQINELKKIYKNKKINIIHSFKALVWQGPYYIQEISKKIDLKKINYIVETKNNLGLIISLIDLGIKKISISSYLDKNVENKILSIAKKKNVDIYFTNKFRMKKNSHFFSKGTLQ